MDAKPKRQPRKLVEVKTASPNFVKPIGPRKKRKPELGFAKHIAVHQEVQRKKQRLHSEVIADGIRAANGPHNPPGSTPPEVRKARNERRKRKMRLRKLRGWH
jgi:hypothetical protein